MKDTLTPTQEKVLTYHKDIGHKVCPKFEDELSKLVYEFIEDTKEVYIVHEYMSDAEVKVDYLTHAFASILDDAIDKLGFGHYEN